MTIPNTFSNGTAADGTEVNENFTYVTNKIHQIYTDNGLDISETGAGDSNSVELDAVSSANLAGRTYLKISITAAARSSGTSAPQINFKIETKEIGGEYSDSLAIIDWVEADVTQLTTRTLSWVHTLTGGEKTNGVQVQLTTSAPANGDGVQQFTNIQIIEESIGN